MEKEVKCRMVFRRKKAQIKKQPEVDKGLFKQKYDIQIK